MGGLEERPHFHPAAPLPSRPCSHSRATPECHRFNKATLKKLAADKAKHEAKAAECAESAAKATASVPGLEAKAAKAAEAKAEAEAKLEALLDKAKGEVRCSSLPSPAHTPSPRNPPKQTLQLFAAAPPPPHVFLI